MRHSLYIQHSYYPKANYAQLHRNSAIEQITLANMQNGEAAAVLQDVTYFEKYQETIALLKILVLGKTQIKDGQVTSAAKAFAQIRRGNR